MKIYLHIFLLISYTFLTTYLFTSYYHWDINWVSELGLWVKYDRVMLFLFYLMSVFINFMLFAGIKQFKKDFYDRT